MKTSEFDYKLPQELIAQQPVPDRTHARMMVVQRKTGIIIDRYVSDLPEWLCAEDLLVVNNTKVFPARLFGCKQDSGGHVEVLLIKKTAENTWDAFIRAARTPRVNSWLILASGRIKAQVVSAPMYGRAILRLSHRGKLLDILEQEGVVPLPPYIKRPRPWNNQPNIGQRALDKNRYQTVYARVTGSIAAPTAGFHLSKDLINTLKHCGIRIASVTLHVGLGTFIPVKTENVAQHCMEPEEYSISSEPAGMINETIKGKGRVVAVGSTVVRTLETVLAEHGSIVPDRGRTSLFIYPPYKFRGVDMLLTNFHLPKSTLLMMVSAFAGVELWRRAYEHAIQERYRFYSYGDCMLIV